VRADLTVRDGRLQAITQRQPKRRHGRLETRMLWALADPALNAYLGSSGSAGRPWPHLAQVCRVERQRLVVRTGGVVTKETREVSYYVTSQSATRADAPTLAHQIRGHWGIENKSHWVRDEIFGEDACQTRTGAAPQMRAACLNLVLALLRRSGVTNVAAALRTYAGRPALAVHLIASAGVMKKPWANDGTRWRGTLHRDRLKGA
jgi:predicted transposase YbfD/YdcC